MPQSEKLSVSQVSKIAGVSVKTLHHYDRKGLLVPSRDSNGYRFYTQHDLVSLQQILIYRELDFSIEETKSLMSENNQNLLTALEGQRQLLEQRQQSITSMIKSLEGTMKNIQTKANFDIFFEDIPKEKVERWENLTKERMGTEDINKGLEGLADLSEEKMRELKQESVQITEEFAKTIGLPADDKKVQEITHRHYLSVCRFLIIAKATDKEVGYDGYVAMANSVDHQEMHELCEHYGEGYAEHARAAMLYYANKHLAEENLTENDSDENNFGDNNLDSKV